MPNSIHIRQCLRKEPNTREDYLLLKLKQQGLLPCKEKKVVQLPKAPGVFSLGPERMALEVPNNEVVQPVEEALPYGQLTPKNKKIFDLDTIKNYFSELLR